MSKKLKIPSLEKWKKTNPKESKQIENIIELSNQLGFGTLKPIVEPRVNFTSLNPIPKFTDELI